MMKKRKFCTWKSNAKKVNVSTNKKLIELREDRSLSHDGLQKSS